MNSTDSKGIVILPTWTLASASLGTGNRDLLFNNVLGTVGTVFVSFLVNLALTHCSSRETGKS